MGASANDASVQRQTTAGQLTPSTRGGNTVVNVKTLKREDYPAPGGSWNFSPNPEYVLSTLCMQELSADLRAGV
jgi:hypothetical protein